MNNDAKIEQSLLKPEKIWLLERCFERESLLLWSDRVRPVLSEAEGVRGQTNVEMQSKFNRGFTLIELLVVVLILGLIAGLVAPRLFGRVSQSKQTVAQTQIELLGVALDNYNLDVGQYPTSEQGLQALQVDPQIENWGGPYLKKELPVDPWGNPYIYTSPGEHGAYDLVSHGADRVPGGEGDNVDIVNWKAYKRAR